MTKDITWPAWTGPLDYRSDPVNMPPQSWRMRQNFWSPDINKICRAPGWSKLFSATPYNNDDLHDQLLSLQTFYDPVAGVDQSTIQTWPNASCTGALQTRTTGRQPISLLFNAKSSYGTRKLIAGTASRLYVHNYATGNWKMIADGMGDSIDDGSCPRTRFYATQNSDVVLFTNNYDEPVYWLFDRASFGCAMRAVETIPDLALIGLRRAAVTWTWRNVTFLADVEMDGTRLSHRMVWSDYKNPLSYDPANPASISGFRDLEIGEKILGGMEVGNYFYIYTSKGVWIMAAVGGEIIFDIQKRYNPLKPGDGCLFYRNTLVSAGDTHYYMGFDGIYAFDLYRPRPERVQWIHMATGVIYDDLDTTCCDQTWAEYDPVRKHILLSWVQASERTCCPSQTLLINLNSQVASTIDFGFTAGINAQVGTGQTLRQWLIENCICSSENLDDLGFGNVKEGLPYAAPAPSDCPPIDSICTNIGYNIAGYYIEDWNQLVCDYTSICYLIGDEPLLENCEVCESPPIFIAASSEDWCLKELWTQYNRERCTNPAAVGVSDADGYHSAVATYVLDGYDSIVRTGPQGWGTKKEKILDAVDFDMYPEVQTVPNLLYIRIGQSANPLDPNTTVCTIQWDDQDPITMGCNFADEATMDAEGTRPDVDGNYGFPTYYVGSFLYLEFKITGTGGAACFASLEWDVRMA